MELLTDKAKQDFEAWLQGIDDAPYCGHFFESPLIVQYAYIIEWFDSVGMGVDTCSWLKSPNVLEYGADIMATFEIENRHKTLNLGKFWNSRPEATKAAIEKANELYNLKHVKDQK